MMKDITAMDTSLALSTKFPNTSSLLLRHNGAEAKEQAPPHNHLEAWMPPAIWMILLGNIPNQGLIKPGVSAAVYSRELVDSTGNPFEQVSAIKRPRE